MNSSIIIKSIEAVTAKWTRQRKKEERGRSRSTRGEALTYSSRIQIKEVAWRVMKAAYMKVSDGGKWPALARQIMYAARKEILEQTGRRELDSQYFTQKLLPDYIRCHPHAGDWDVVYDARGHLEEPHTKMIVPLGTLDVREYLQEIEDHAVAEIGVDCFDKQRQYPTKGPHQRFGAVLFIEKEGFMPLFKAAKVAERYDIAIMSTKGMPVVAARKLADELCGEHDVPLLVLHDFDKAGFSIMGTLAGVNHGGPRTSRNQAIKLVQHRRRLDRARRDHGRGQAMDSIPPQICRG